MSDTSKTVSEVVVAEGTSATIGATAYDNNDPPIPIPGSVVTEKTVTIYARIPGLPIINDRDRVNLSELGTWDEAGEIELTLDPDDSPIVGGAAVLEIHVVLIEWVYDEDKAGKHEVLVPVRNLGRVP